MTWRAPVRSSSAGAVRVIRVRDLRRAWQVGPSFLPTFLLLGALPAALQAATLPADDSLLHPAQSASMAIRSVRPGGVPASALDRALQVDTGAGQRNLDLLLETRGSAAAAVDLQVRRSALSPVNRPSSSSPMPSTGPDGVAGRPVPAAPLPNLLALVTEAGLAPLMGRNGDASVPEQAPSRREWMGAVGNGSGAAAQIDRHAGVVELVNEARTGGLRADDGQDRLLFNVLQDVVGFIREHRDWLIGGAVLLLLGQLLLRWMLRPARRTGGRQATHRAPIAPRDPLGPPVVHHHRRRSSRRG